MPNSKKIYLQFAKALLYNERTIYRKDNNGNPCRLVNVGFPYGSKYFGCYITLNVNKIRESPFSEKMVSTDLYEAAKYSIYYFVKETDGEKKKEIIEKLKGDGFEEHKKLRNVLVKQIPTLELKEEFDSWRNIKQEENDLEEPDICD